MNLEIIPVNQTCLVRCVPKKEWKEMRGMTGDDFVQIGSIFVPSDVNFEHDPDDTIVYDVGIIEKLSEGEPVPFNLELDMICVYNHGAVVDWDKARGIKKKIVKYSDIIVVFKKGKEENV